MEYPSSLLYSIGTQSSTSLNVSNEAYDERKDDIPESPQQRQADASVAKQVNVDVCLFKNRGAAIRNIRESQKMTLTQLANKTGIGKPSISKIENGHNIPTPESLSLIANALGVIIPQIDMKALLLGKANLSPDLRDLFEKLEPIYRDISKHVLK